MQLFFALTLSLLALAAILGLSFLGTTWFAMLLAGMAGHFAHNAWLMHLGFWDCSPVWVMVILVKMIFGKWELHVRR